MYFDQLLVTVDSKCWSKSAFSRFFAFVCKILIQKPRKLVKTCFFFFFFFFFFYFFRPLGYLAPQKTCFQKQKIMTKLIKTQILFFASFLFFCVIPFNIQYNTNNAGLNIQQFYSLVKGQSYMTSINQILPNFYFPKPCHATLAF